MIDGKSQRALALPKFNASLHPVTKRTTRIGLDFFQGEGGQGLFNAGLELSIAIFKIRFLSLCMNQ